MSAPLFAQIPLLLSALGVAGASFLWLLLQTVTQRRIGWIPAVVLPAVLAIGSAVTMFPQVIALFTGSSGGSWLWRLGAPAAAMLGGMLFDQASRPLLAQTEPQGSRSGWPLMLWGIGALLFAGAPAVSFAPKLAAWLESLGGAVGSTSVFALLGQAMLWTLRLRPNPTPPKTPPPSFDPVKLRRGSFFGGGLFSAIAVALLFGVSGGGAGGTAPANAFLLSAGGPLSNKEIFVFDRGTSSQRTLPREGGGARWSPDGTRMVFMRAEPSEIWTAAANGASAQRIHRREGLITGFIWSGDGRQIYFTHSPGFLGGGLHVIPADGGSAEQILPVSEGVDHPALSPDGRQLAYFRGIDTTRTVQPPQEVKLLDLATRQSRALVSEPRWSMTALGWTRDGQALIVSVLDEPGRQCRLERIDIGSPRRQPLTPFMNFFFADISPLPDEDAIALLASPRLANGNLDFDRPTEIWLVDPRTGNRTTVASQSSPRPSALQPSPISASRPAR